VAQLAAGRRVGGGLALPILFAASVCHFLNDATQSLFTASYPLFKSGFDLNFAQIGVLTLAYQVSASILQPIIGLYTDRHPAPYSLPVGMGVSAAALVTVAYAPNYPAIVAGAALLGIGSSIFHPESSRLARLASGGAHGLAQSIFQVGGNIGSSIGPLVVAFVILPGGRGRLAWFAVLALCGMAISGRVGGWYARALDARPRSHAARPRDGGRAAQNVRWPMAILAALIFSKYFYIASFTSYYVFYLEQRFQATQWTAQICLFVFLGAVAIGTVIGGPVGDRIGRKTVIWGSILGVLPFTLILPYVSMPITIALSAVIGLILASAFPAIVVYAQELLPHRIGLVSGLFFGLAFGMGGLGAAVLGVLADATSVEFVYKVCAFLPMIGALAAFLPETRTRAMAATTVASGR